MKTKKNVGVQAASVQEEKANVQAAGVQEEKPDVQAASVKEEKKAVSEPLLMKITYKSTFGLKSTRNYLISHSQDWDTTGKNNSNDEN